MKEIDALYCRISTDDGTQHSVSIHRQQEELLALAARNGHSILPAYIFIDEGRSGRTLKRPAMQKLLELIRANKIRTLYFYELSRLSRDIIDSQELLKLCIEKNVKLISAYGSVDTSTPENEFSTGIQIQLNRYWSSKTSFALKRYRKHAKASGIYHAHKAPLGLRREGKFPNITWSKTPDFALVEEILQLYLAGQGSSTITRQLNELGRTWKSGRTKRLPLNPDSVVNIVKGIERYEQFLSPATYALILQIREERRDRHGNHGKMKHPSALLRGLVVCVVCGTKYSSAHHPHDKRYEWTYYHPNYVKCNNPRKSIPRAELDAQIWQYVKQIEKQLGKPPLQKTSRLPARDFAKEKQGLEAQLKNYARMLGKEQITEGEYDDLRAETLKQLDALQKELDKPGETILSDTQLTALLESITQTLLFVADVPSGDANRALRILFAACPVFGVTMETPIIHANFREHFTLE